jgi:anaerobic selenocysteine-containing dehydrogenase
MPAPAPARRRLKVVCPHDCPDTCVMTVDVEGDRAVALGGDPDHRFTRGFLCAKVNHYLDRVYSPQRVLHPMRRGRQGEGRFERVSWDEALDTVAGRLREVAARHGPQAILPYSYAGNMGLLGYGSMDRRFFHALGASLLGRTICATAGAHGFKATVGEDDRLRPRGDRHARLIVAWGRTSSARTCTSGPSSRRRGGAGPGSCAWTLSARAPRRRRTGTSPPGRGPTRPSPSG